MRKNLTTDKSKMIQRKSRVHRSRFFYTIQSILLRFHVLALKRASPEWRIIILAGLSHWQYYTVRTSHTIPLILAGYRTQVIHSKLRSTNGVTGYLELWDEGRLTRRIELYRPSEDILTIRCALCERIPFFWPLL